MAKITRTAGPGAERLRVALQNLGNKKTQVGYIDGTKYEDGTPVAQVAAIQEFGVPERSLPPRPFMRPTVAQDTPEWRRLAESGARAIMAGNADSQTVMEALGQSAAGGIRKTISEIQSPPLTYTTLRLRKLKRDGVQMGGKLVGDVFRTMNAVGPRAKADKSADISGVSTKPLVFDGILLGAVTSSTEDA